MAVGSEEEDDDEEEAEYKYIARKRVIVDRFRIISTAVSAQSIIFVLRLYEQH